ncbi:MAG: VanZ family protein [Elusimicrobiota bacterium]
MTKTLRLFSLWLPVGLWCSLIFYMSAVPFLKTELGFWDLVLRKIAHMVEFGTLFLLARRALKNSGFGLALKEVNLASFVFSMLYAVSDEYHQAFVPGRGPSPVDAGIDTIGITFAYIISKTLQITNFKLQIKR